MLWLWGRYWFMIKSEVVGEPARLRKVEVVELVWPKRHGRTEETPGWPDRMSTLPKPNKGGAYRVSYSLTTTIRLSLCIPASEPKPLPHLHYGCYDTLHHTTRRRMR